LFLRICRFIDVHVYVSDQSMVFQLFERPTWPLLKRPLPRELPLFWMVQTTGMNKLKLSNPKLDLRWFGNLWTLQRRTMISLHEPDLPFQLLLVWIQQIPQRWPSLRKRGWESSYLTTRTRSTSELLQVQGNDLCALSFRKQSLELILSTRSIAIRLMICLSHWRSKFPWSIRLAKLSLLAVIRDWRKLWKAQQVENNVENEKRLI